MLLLLLPGCYAQVAKEELERMEEIDLILGNNEKNNIVEMIEKSSKDVISDISSKQQYQDFEDMVYTEKTRIVIKVQDGCDNFCSYCIIPYAKGRVRSRKIDSVINEIKKAVKERRLPAAARQGSYIFLLGLLCPFFWIALFRGASPEELRFHATHSGIVALIGLVIMVIGLIKEKPGDRGN